MGRTTLKNKNNENKYFNIIKNNIKNNNQNKNNKNEKKIITKIYRFTGEIKLNNETNSEISFEKANLEKNSKLIFVNEKDCNDYQQVDLSDFIVRRSQIKNPLLSLKLSLNYSLNQSSLSPPPPPPSSPSASSSSLLSSHSSS